MGEADMNIMEQVMKAVFGTDARCREAERKEADELLARVERKVARLNDELNGRQARNIDEALRQTSGSDR